MAAGVVLIAGSAACAAAAFVGRPRVVWLLAAAGLACAAAAELLDSGDESFAVASCVLVTAGAALLVLRLHPDVTRLSWLDAAMGASSTAALAVALGSGPAEAVAIGGVAGVIALSRWRPAMPVVVTLAGLAVLGAGECRPRSRRCSSVVPHGCLRGGVRRGPSSVPWCSRRSSPSR